MTTKTRLNAITRRLDKLAPAEPPAFHVVFHDEATGEDEPDGRASRVIQLRWPEDEDSEKRARDIAPGRA